MSFARKLYERFRHLIHEVAKFGVVGGIAFVVTELTFNFLLHAGLDSFAANAGSTLIAAVVAFVGNRYWTFRTRDRVGMGRETVLFFLLNGIGILIQQGCIELAKLGSGRHDALTVNAAFLFGVMLATLFRFWSYRKWVWRLAPPGAEPIEPVEPDLPVHAGDSAVGPAQLNGHANGQSGQGTDERIIVASGPGRHRANRD